MAHSSAIIPFFLISLSLFSISCSSLSPPQTRPFTLPIGKDTETNLYYTNIGIGTPQHNMELVIDLGGPILWYDCDKRYNSSTYKPLSCSSKRCPGDTFCSGCNGPFKPGCTNDTCGSYIINQFADSIFTGGTGDDVLFISHTQVRGLLSGCIAADESLKKGLPKTSKGILGLARKSLALQNQLSSAFKLPNKFSLCLTSSNKKGLGNLIIGGVPHASNNIPILTTPLLINPVSTAPISTQGDASYEYFIGVKSIKVGGKVVNSKSTLLSFDKNGKGGTKISTMDSFTVLHSSIFNPLVREFVKQSSDKKMKKVASVGKFEACFDFSSIGRSITVLDVPTIDLVLEGGVEWTLYGSNSMVLVKKNVACFAFVDGGKDPRTAIVIGGHQLEDNLLEFDLVSSKLGFSSSLLLHKSRCSHITS